MGREHELEVRGHSEEEPDGDRLHQRVHRETGEETEDGRAEERDAGGARSHEGAAQVEWGEGEQVEWGGEQVERKQPCFFNKHAISWNLPQ